MAQLSTQASDEHTIRIAFATNEYYMPCLGVLITSILEHASAEDFYEFYVLHLHLSPGSMERIRSVCQKPQKSEIYFLDVSWQMDKYSFYVENRPEFSREAYCRLLLPDLLSEYDRILYLDCDMVACTDIAPLYHEDLDGYLLASSRDMTGIGMYHAPNSIRREYQDNVLYLTDPDNYFISGMLVLNLAELRQRFDPGELLRIAAEKRYQQHDQDVLNVYCGDRTKLVDCAWDVVEWCHFYDYLPVKLREEASESLKKPYIFHFAGDAGKPWYLMTGRAVNLFWGTALKTPYYRELLERIDFTRRDEIESMWTTPAGNGPIMSLKKFLKKILPPPVNSFNREIERVLKSIDEEKQLTLLLMKQLAEQTGETQRNEAKPSNPIYKQVADMGDVMFQTPGSDMSRILPLRKLHFEVSLVGHCNLNCKGCAHFSCLGEEEFADLEEVTASFQRLSELFDKEAEYIHLLGGEPLLHPDICGFMVQARTYFPKAKVQLVTNGLKLLSMDEAFYQCCRENQIEICVTKYPVQTDYEKIKTFVEEKQVQFSFYLHDDEVKTFNKLSLDVTGTQKGAENFVRCYMANSCIFLYHGRLYPCSVIPNTRFFNRHFGQQLQESPEDSIDIFKALSADEILNFLCKPVPFCRYCNLDKRRGDVKWEISKKSATEWVDET